MNEGSEPLSRLIARTPRPGPAAAVRLALGLLDEAAAGRRFTTPDEVRVGEAGVRVEPGEGGAEYAAPEIALGETVDDRAAVYAVGVLLWELLAGRPAFEGKTRKELVSAHLLRTPPPLREAAPEVAADLAAVVERAMSRRTEERFASVAEMRAALVAAAPAEAEPQPEPEPQPQPEPRHTRRMAGPEAPLPSRAPSRLPPRWSFLTVAVILLALGAWSLIRPVPAGKRKLAEVVAVESALARGDLETARAEAERLARTYPDDGRAYALLGHVLFARREKERALAAYREALRLEPDLGGAPEVLANLRATFADPKHGEAAFRLTEAIGAPAEPILSDLAAATGEARLKRRAAEAIGRIRQGEER